MRKLQILLAIVMVVIGTTACGQVSIQNEMLENGTSSQTTSENMNNVIKPENQTENNVGEDTNSGDVKETEQEDELTEEPEKETEEHVHQYDMQQIKEATCIEKGAFLYMCGCGEQYIEASSMTPHKYGDYTYNNDATYTADGTMVATCEFCGDIISKTAEGTKLEYTYTEVSKEMVVSSSVNVRSTPSTSGKKIGSLGEGERVMVLGQCNETKWYQIKYNDEIGYVSNKYLKEPKVISMEDLDGDGYADLDTFTVWNGMEVYTGFISPETAAFKKALSEAPLHTLMHYVSKNGSESYYMLAKTDEDMYRIFNEKMDELNKWSTYSYDKKWSRDGSVYCVFTHSFVNDVEFVYELEEDTENVVFEYVCKGNPQVDGFTMVNSGHTEDTFPYISVTRREVGYWDDGQEYIGLKESVQCSQKNENGEYVIRMELEALKAGKHIFDCWYMSGMEFVSQRLIMQ